MKGVITVPEKGRYENLAEKNARGEYDLVEPLDYLILEILQDEGTLMGGYYPLATSVPTLRKEHFPALNTTLISTRLRVLNLQDLVVPVKLSSRISGWQRTKKGKELAEAWRQAQK